MRLLLLVSALPAIGCAYTSHQIQSVAPHRDQLIVVAVRTVEIPGVGKDARQTVNACELADEGDRLVCRRLGVEFDAPLPPIGIGYRDGTGGAEVTRVSEGGLAALAGLQAADVIVSVDGAPTPDAKALRQALEKAGRSVSLQMRRGDQTITGQIRR